MSGKKCGKSESPMTLAQVRAELKGAKGKKYWRSVDELANTPEFQAAVEREFPHAIEDIKDPVTRRGFMKLMGASMALAGGPRNTRPAASTARAKSAFSERKP